MRIIDEFLRFEMCMLNPLRIHWVNDDDGKNKIKIQKTEEEV